MGWVNQELTHPLEILIWIFTKADGLRARNNLPNDYSLEEFEVIYD